MKHIFLNLPKLLVYFLSWQLSEMPVQAQWSTNSNVNNAICIAAYNQEAPAIVSDGTGGAIITWQDARSNAGVGIYAQRISANGLPLWKADGVLIADTNHSQGSPAITSDGLGGAIITWYDLRTGISYGSGDIYAQRINSSGVVQWMNDGVAICTQTQYQQDPFIVSDGAGGAIITWKDYRSSTENTDIYAQRINYTGVVQWTQNGVAISTAPNDQLNARIVSDGSGGAVISWMDYRNSPSDSYASDIFAQRINASGSVQWTANGVAVSTAAGDQYNPTMASDGAGGAIITWKDFRSGTGSSDIYAQRINAAGSTQWTANGVAICTAAQDQTSPTIVNDDAGGAIITWDDLRSNLGTDIYAQRINASGSVQWTVNGEAISTAANSQYYPTIVSDGAKGAIITWEDWRGSTADIYAQHISDLGVVQWLTNGVAVSTAAGHQYTPAIAWDGAGGAIITWKEYNRINPDYDIYAQQVNKNGQLGMSRYVGNNKAVSTSIFLLEQNYPNPFSSLTNISFSLSSRSFISIGIFDVFGKEVQIVLEKELPEGKHSMKLDASGLKNGVYFCRVQVGYQIETTKLLLQR